MTRNMTVTTTSETGSSETKTRQLKQVVVEVGNVVVKISARGRVTVAAVVRCRHGLKTCDVGDEKGAES